MLNNKHFQSMLKIIKEMAYSRDIWEIFYDFLEMGAIAVSNCVDLNQYEAREKQYMTVIHKYTSEHQKLFPELLAQLVLALDCEFQRGNFADVLGSLFHELELHNKFKGQFFTPQHICDFMGKILLNENDKAILEQGYISVAEPACGSGAMVLGFANAVKECGYNHSHQMFVFATDIDLKCVYMCYLQLALYGIPAMVVHGNSLTLEEWSHWYTPAYIINGWGWKLRHPRTAVQSEKVIEDAQAIDDVQVVDEPLAVDEAQKPEAIQAVGAMPTIEQAQTVEEIQPNVRFPTHKEAVTTFEQLDLFALLNEESP